MMAEDSHSRVDSKDTPTFQEADSLSEDDVAAIRSLIHSYEQAVLAGAYAAAAALWTEDVIRMPPHAPTIEGRAAMLEEYAAREYVVNEFSQAFEDIDGRDGLAYARGPYSITITMPGSPQPISDIGKSLAILRKQQDGSWLIAVACWNSDLPPPEMSPEQAS
jgi:ketosteroid isomerase-like protein